jgi:Spy/CpxP family protein refolding chaperone
MKNFFLPLALSLAATALFVQAAAAQMSTPPASKAELEAVYTTGIENRTADILKPLNLSDGAISNQVHDIIIAQYRALRARDEVIDAQLKADGKEINYANRSSQLAITSKPLHDQFLAKLGQVLTPDQVDKVKDMMTYNKVNFTYNAYCNIVPDLTDADKAKILELLKLAREEAMDGGSAPEKSSIFQKYKDQINDYLDANGHDVAKATQEWKAKQVSASSAATNK